VFVDPTGKYLQPHISYKGEVLEALKRRCDIDDGVAGLVVSSGRPLRIGDVRQVPEYIEISPDIRSELCVPIISDDRVTGVINIESSKLNAFDEADERLIRTIAGGLATAIQKIRLFDAEGRRVRS
jgi:putative methionine-R-sulfoxide reductase with GAF domain